MNNKEIDNLVSSIAFKIICRSVGLSLLIFAGFLFIVDLLLNDFLAEFTVKTDVFLYYFLVENKEVVLLLTYIVVLLFSVFVISKGIYKNYLKITTAIDDIIKNPRQKVNLPEDLYILESKLESIRLDFVNSLDRTSDAEAKKNELIMYMAHDLKTPLTSVIGYLSLVNEEKNITKKLREKYVSIALDKALRVEDLTNQFFEITRYNIKDMPLNKSDIDLSMLIDQLLEDFYPLLQEKNLKMVANKTGSIKFYADGDKIARCFGNILKNAINYSYNDSVIEIDLIDNKDNIEITFKNKGDRIPDHKLDRIFERFYRADEARHSSGGTGLGLAIAKEIVELHNGTISVENKNEFIIFKICFSRNAIEAVKSESVTGGVLKLQSDRKTKIPIKDIIISIIVIIFIIGLSILIKNAIDKSYENKIKNDNNSNYVDEVDKNDYIYEDDNVVDDKKRG